MEAWGELLTPDSLLRNPDGWPEPGPHGGRAAVVRQTENVRDTWDANALDSISDFGPAGGRVVVRLNWRGTGHGPELQMELTCVYTVREEKMLGLELFWDHAKALATLGLA